MNRARNACWATSVRRKSSHSPRARRARRPTVRDSERRRRVVAERPTAAPRSAPPAAARSRSAVPTVRRQVSRAPRNAPPAGGRPQVARSGPVERGLGLLGDLAEGRGVADRDVGQHLPVERDLGLAQPRDELVVGQPFAARGCVDPHDPKAAEVPLLVLAVTVGVDERMLDLLLRTPVARVLEPPVALGLAKHLPALLTRVNGSLDSRHLPYFPRSLLTSRTSAGLTGSAWRNPRLRLADFFSR